MNRVALVLVSLYGLSSIASSRIWPDPGSECRPVRVAVGPDSQLAQVKISPARKLRMPTSLSVTNPAIDTPQRARLRMRVVGTLGWQDCQFLRGTGGESNRFSRVSCSIPPSDEVVDLVELAVSMPKGQAATLASISEVAPCANSPRSYDGKTVLEGGKFFPMTPTSSRWVAVLDEVYVSRATLEQAAASLASQYGLSLDQLMWGPFGFSFSGSSSKAKDLSGNSIVRFVQSEVIYQGAGAVNSVVPFGAGDSWALDRLDQRESLPEMLGHGGADQRYRFPESERPQAERPAVFVVDNAVQNHATFAGVGIVPIAVPGARSQCPVGALQSAHGTSSLGMLLGQVGVVRTPPRQALAVAALGLGGVPSTCTYAEERTIVGALEIVESIAEPGDIVSLSFASRGFGMSLEMKVNQLSRSGILIFAATGNEFSDRITPPSDAEGAIAVGALDRTGDDQRWQDLDGGSNGRGTDVDFHAPGENVVVASDVSWQAVTRASGTSVAAPAVAALGFYHVLVSDLSGLAPNLVRDRVRELLAGSSTVRTQTGILVPFTPTVPLVRTLKQIPFQMDLAATASDPNGLWLAGFQSGSASILRVPFDSSGDPDVAATQIVLNGGSGSRCLTVAAAGDTATAGCWTTSLAGQLRLYRVNATQDGGTVATEEAVMPLPDLLPLSVAADVSETIEGSQQATAEVDFVRTAVAVKVSGVNEWGNPLIGDTLSLAVARFGGGTWSLSVVPIGSAGARYSLAVESALNCDNINSCEVYALLARTNPSAGYPDYSHTDAIELWRVPFQTASQAPVGEPVLLASRTDTGPFYTCHVNGWAYSLGLVPVAVSLDLGATGPRWSFAYRRDSTGMLGSSCGFDSLVRVATTPSPADDQPVGAPGERWRAGGSRGAWTRTNLVLVDVWNPSRSDFDVRFLSTVRTLHPRGSSPVPATLNMMRVQHSLYGDDGMGLFLSADHLTWSVARILP